jgi:hypothetical protein
VIDDWLRGWHCHRTVSTRKWTASGDGHNLKQSMGFIAFVDTLVVNAPFSFGSTLGGTYSPPRHGIFPNKHRAGGREENGPLESKRACFCDAAGCTKGARVVACAQSKVTGCPNEDVARVEETDDYHATGHGEENPIEKVCPDALKSPHQVGQHQAGPGNPGVPPKNSAGVCV